MVDVRGSGVCVAPGKIVDAFMREHDYSLTEMSNILGVRKMYLLRFIHGIDRITMIVAVNLQELTGIRAHEWIKMDNDYHKGRSKYDTLTRRSA